MNNPTECCPRCDSPYRHLLYADCRGFDGAHLWHERNNSVHVGERFKKIDKLAYREDGVPHMHRIVRVIEITSVEGHYAEWKTVAILKEYGRPSWNPDVLTWHGGFRVDRMSGFEKVEGGREKEVQREERLRELVSKISNRLV